MNETTSEQNPQETEPQSPALKEGTRPAAAPRRYVVTLFARATAEEKRRVEQRARRAGLSVSRYLVRAAAEERPPPGQKERERLEDLLYLFKRTGLFLDHLAANAEGLERVGATAPMQQELRETARLLASLCTELKRRL